MTVAFKALTPEFRLGILLEYIHYRVDAWPQLPLSFEAWWHFKEGIEIDFDFGTWS